MQSPLSFRYPSSIPLLYELPEVDLVVPVLQFQLQRVPKSLSRHDVTITSLRQRMRLVPGSLDVCQPPLVHHFAAIVTSYVVS